MRYPLAGFIIFAFSTTVLAATVPNTFTAGSPAKASEVNANFAALVSAVTALEGKVATLETKVAALESVNSPLTAADVAGTYRLLALRTDNGSKEADKRFKSAAATTDGTLTLNANGTFNAVVDSRSNEYSGKAQDCASRAANTSNTSVSGVPHNHQYTEANCNQNAAAFTSVARNELGLTATGAWSVNAGTSTITVTPADGAPITVYISKRGGVGFAVEVEDINDPSSPGRAFSLDVLVRQ